MIYIRNQKGLYLNKVNSSVVSNFNSKKGVLLHFFLMRTLSTYGQSLTNKTEPKMGVNQSHDRSKTKKYESTNAAKVRKCICFELFD